MDVFEALADPRRRQVVQMLSARPCRAGELADAAGMSAPAMSRHLKTLLDAAWSRTSGAARTRACECSCCAGITGAFAREGKRLHVGSVMARLVQLAVLSTMALATEVANVARFGRDAPRFAE